MVTPAVVVWYIRGFHGDTSSGSVVHQLSFHGDTSSGSVVHQRFQW